ncbi:Hsp20 family protein [Candidatus Parcubacteria bacterium]|nr:Hsp20 family protein [Candidatus Parcubacteria bacterium]
MKSFFEPLSGHSILTLHVSETEKEYNLSMLAPGLHRSEIKVFVKDEKVTITNKKENSSHPLQGPGYSFSTFSKSFTTLHEIDSTKIRISYKNDIINITLVKGCRDIPLIKSASHPVVAEV